MWPWTSHLTSPGFGFFICKIRRLGYMIPKVPFCSSIMSWTHKHGCKVVSPQYRTLHFEELLIYSRYKPISLFPLFHTPVFFWLNACLKHVIQIQIWYSRSAKRTFLETAALLFFSKCPRLAAEDPNFLCICHCVDPMGQATSIVHLTPFPPPNSPDWVFCQHWEIALWREGGKLELRVCLTCEIHSLKKLIG